MSEKYVVYQYKKDMSGKSDIFCWNTIGYSLKIKKVSFKEELFFRTILFALASKGRHKIYCLYDKKGLAHFSFVVPYCAKFSFIKKEDYQIGPCWTRDDCRGQGLYGKMLTYISEQKIKDCSSANTYVLVREANKESTKGIKKTRFIRVGICEKTKYLRHYKNVVKDSE